MEKLGIKMELFGNYPWIYIYKINGELVTERFMANYGFTLAFMPVRSGEEVKFTDITKIFNLIRKYII
jgi:hypothetical protein